MAKFDKSYHNMRSRYQIKRRSKFWQDRKKEARIQREQGNTRLRRDYYKNFLTFKASANFSFVENTNVVLDYYKECQEAFRNGKGVNFDFTGIENLSPDTILLHVACIKDPTFRNKGKYKGNAPDSKEAYDLFTKSGFYKYVRANSIMRGAADQEHNVMHNESAYNVRPKIAKNACIKGLTHVNGSPVRPFPPLYEILIEAMQNTNNHASASTDGKMKWWLYVYNDESTKTSKFTFLDLGVGIFESIVVKTYILNFAQKQGIVPNTRFVDKLLSGSLQSRIELDKEMRGKGIPQILENAQLDCFKVFYIITNDVKINLKTKESELLKSNFNGTLLYWELQQTNGNDQ